VLLQAAGYNLVSRQAMFSRYITVVDGSNLKKYVGRAMLDFDVLYAMLHMISYTITISMTNSRQKKETALTILDRFYRRKHRIYDPLLF